MKKFLLLLSLFLSSIGIVSAQIIVKGTIKDENNNPVVYANVYEKGSLNGITTDDNGDYLLRCVSEKPVLVISFIGYITQEIKITTQPTAPLNITLKEGATLDAIEIVGSRSLNRSVTNSPVAIDIIDIKAITTQVGQLDVNQLLQYAAPSFNSTKQSGSDGSDHIDPATLRGLGPDQTLVLINGKRRHQSSLVNVYGTRGRGNTGTDLNAIPAFAIERVEILRDGASAQYGSDAIAGVINIVLKSNTEDVNVNFNTGINRATTAAEKDFDGGTAQINANYGVKIAKSGFLNFTADYLQKDRTNRPDGAIYRKQFGDAKSENFAMYLNSKVPIDEKAYFYAFGGFNNRNSDAYAFTREADDAERNVKAIYPNGFNPRILTNIVDVSAAAGVRSQWKGFDVDFSSVFGQNTFHFYGDGTLNASLLEKSPTKFDDGGFKFSQQTTGINFSKFYKEVKSGLNVAFGTEYRVDRYAIFKGEEASWQNYGIIDTVINGRVQKFDALGKSAGSQGFPGFRPENEVNESRTNIAAYVDAELNMTRSWLVAAALRGERYSDFGNTVNGKLATRYAISPTTALRASVSTGFRAPSLAQLYYNQIFTNVAGGQIIEQFLAKNNSSITRALGIEPLKQETATNASVGITVGLLEGLTATVDGYYVQVKDRVVLTGSFTSDDPDIGNELKKINVSSAQFFTNAVDTRTLGLDAILTYITPLGDGRLTTSLAANFNKMDSADVVVNTNAKLRNKADIYFSTRERSFLLASAPRSKVNLTIDYRLKKFNANLRFVRFDKIELENYAGNIDVYTPKITTDLALGYDVSSNYRLTLGAANLFNVYPDKQDPENSEGGGIWDSVQMGIGGSFYYARMGFKF